MAPLRTVLIIQHEHDKKVHIPCVMHAGGSTFGIRTYGSSSYQATGASGAYKVDTLTNKLAYSAFKSAL